MVIALFAWFMWSFAHTYSLQTAEKNALTQFNYFYAVTLTLNLLCTGERVEHECNL